MPDSGTALVCHMGWTVEDFERAARKTKLEKPTLDACRDVLVHGRKAVEAGRAHDVLPPHISRAVRRLGEELDKLRLEDQEAARAHRVANGDITVGEVFYAAAREAAQSIKGAGWIIRDAAPGNTYEGAGVVKVGGYFVQDTGRVGVIHDMRQLVGEPELGKRLEIRYPAQAEEKAQVAEISPDRGTRERSR